LLQFEHFVNSPYFNKKTAVVSLFNYLKDFYPKFDNTKKLERESLYRILYPGKPYNYGVIKNIIYEFTLLGEKFLEFTCCNKNKPELYRNLLNELINRDLKKSFKKNLKNAELLLHKERKGDIYFRNKMDIELLKFNFHIKKEVRTEKLDFDFNAGRLLISYFLIKFFKINYNNLVTQNNFGKPGYIHFLDEVLNYFRKTPEIDPVILLYYNKFMLLYTEDETYYRKFKQLVREQMKNLNRKELFNTYINLLNYCFGKIASGEWSYYKELFEIYNEMLSNKIYTSAENDYFDAVLFRLAAETGVKLKKFDWSKRFIKQYSEKLHPKLKLNEINIAFANYFFMKKNYDETQNLLAQTNINTVYDKIYIYIIQSMLYYETKQFESLISEIDAIRHFIINDKILSIENRNSFQKYLKYLNQLVKLNTNEQADKGLSINKLKKSLISEKGILEKHWLLEKISLMSTN
jgi:hypothetical protein